MSSAQVDKFFRQVKGSRPFVLESEYGDDMPKQRGAAWYRNLGWVVDLDNFDDNDPDDQRFLADYAPAQYSIGDFFNGVFAGRQYDDNPWEGGDGPYTLRDRQQEISDLCLDIYDEGRSGFLNASDTGTGKTITAVSTLKQTSARTNLIVAPKSVLPGWRDTLRIAGDAGKLWVLINYESLGRLLLPSKEEDQAKKKSTKNAKRASKGIPLLDFDNVVFDECHYLGNPTSLRSKMARRLSDGNTFRMWMSATFGKDPTKTTFLYPALCEIAGKESGGFSVAKYASLCTKLGIRGVKANDKGGLVDYSGSAADVRHFSDVLFKGRSRFADRIVSEDDQARMPLAVELSRSEMEQYNALWQDFVSEYQEVMRIGDKKVREPQGLAVQIRFRQKAGLLRAPYTVDAIKDQLADGYQVAVSCEFGDTVELLRSKMKERGMAEPAVFTGANAAVREDERLAFQRGEKKVILFSPAEGVNLHANQTEVSGASSAPRSLVIAEPRWSPIKSMQIEGRTQRNGELSTAWYAYATGTIESKVITRMTNGMALIAAMRGDEVDGALKSLRKDIIGEIVSEFSAA